MSDVLPWPPGLLTALVTPFTAAGTLDPEALGRLLDRQVAAGVAGVVVGGGTGEFGALSVDERRDLAGLVSTALDGRLPFLVQTGALATRDAIALGRHAQECGASGLLVASPFGEPITWRERRRFYEQVTDSTALPVVLYNTPPAGIMTVAQIEELASLPHVAAVKDSSGDVTLLGDLLTRSAQGGLAVYVGIDSLVAFAASGGARGVLVGTGNLIPDELVVVLDRFGRHEPAPGWPALRAYLRFLEESPNYVAACKATLRLDDLDVGDVRAPYLMPDEEEQRELARRLQALRQSLADAEHSR